MPRITFHSLEFAILILVQLMKASAAFAADGDVVTKLAAPVEDVALADSGQTLVLKLKGQKGLTIYDAKTQKLATLDLPTSDCVFGAGGDTVVVFLKESNEIRSYNLKTLAQVKSKEFAEPLIVKRIAMGHSRGDLALIRLARESESRAANEMMDIAALSILRPKSPRRASVPDASHRTDVYFGADGHLDRITEWASRYDPSGIGMFIRTDGDYRYRYMNRSAGYLVPGDDGLIYSGYGTIYSLVPEAREGFEDYLTSAGKIEGISPVPSIGGLYFLGIDRDGKISVYQAGQTTPLCEITPFPEWSLPKFGFNGRPLPNGPFPPGQAPAWFPDPLTLDKRVVFVPASGYILFLPSSDDKIIKRKLNLTDALERKGKDYLLVLSNPPLRPKSGAKWDYQITTLAKHGPVKFELAKSPEGMSMSPAGGLAWRVPGGIKGSAEVVVTITDSKSNEIRHAFTVAFQ